MNIRKQSISHSNALLCKAAGLPVIVLLVTATLAAQAEERSVQIVFGGLQCYKTTQGLGDDQPYAAIVAADLRSGKVTSASHSFGDVGGDEMKETKVVVGSFSPLKQDDDLVLLVVLGEHDTGAPFDFDKGGIPGGLTASVAVEKITPIVKKHQAFYSASVQWRAQIVDKLRKAMSDAFAATKNKDDLIGIDVIRLHTEDIVGPGTRSVERSTFLKGDGGAYRLYFDIKSNDAFFGINPPGGGPGIPVVPSLSGKWNSNLGPAELTQKGDNLSGTVNFPNQVAGKITGKIIGTTVNYRWFVFAGHEGGGKLTISSDGKKLSGDFHSDSDPSFKGPWTLTRVAGQSPGTPPGSPPKIPTVAGVWKQLPGNTGLPETTITIGQESNQPENFACRIPDMKLFGKGKIAPDLTVAASYGPPNADMTDFGPIGAIAQGAGKITKVDPKGRATRIEWDNGVVYERK